MSGPVNGTCWWRSLTCTTCVMHSYNFLCAECDHQWDRLSGFSISQKTKQIDMNSSSKNSPSPFRHLLNIGGNGHTSVVIWVDQNATTVEVSFELYLCTTLAQEEYVKWLNQWWLTTKRTTVVVSLWSSHLRSSHVKEKTITNIILWRSPTWLLKTGTLHRHTSVLFQKCSLLNFYKTHHEWSIKK